MPLRILVVARWYPSHEMPGRGSFVADQAGALAATGAQVAVLCPEPAYAEALDGPGGRARIARISRWAATIGEGLAFAVPIGHGAPGVPVLRIPAPLPAGGDASRDPRALAPLEAAVLVPVGLRLHAAWPFDVIHAHTGLPDGLAAAELATAVGVPLLTTEHDSLTPGRLEDPAVAEAYRGLLGPGRDVVAVSRAFAGQVETRLGLDVGRIGVVPNIVLLDTFRTRPETERDPNELLWVGARKGSKGTDTLLHAFDLLHRQRPALRLRLIGRAGSTRDEERLVALAGALGIADAVRFEPPADRGAVAEAMARAAVFVHPSPWETFGVVAAEALAMGLPVAATPSGGVDEIVGRDGRFGTIADDHAPDSLAAAIAATLDRRAEFDPEALRASVADRFAPGAVAAELLGRFAALGAAAGPGGPTLPVPDLPNRPVVLVGFRRSSALARVPAVPAALAAEVSVVTTAPIHPQTGRPAGEPTPPTDVVRWVDADTSELFRARLNALGGVSPGDGAWRRAIRHPLRAVRRRQLWAGQPRLLAEARAAAVAAAVASVVGSSDAPAMLLPLDVDDLEPIERLLAERPAVLAPGTLGWLVDRWASRRP